MCLSRVDNRSSVSRQGVTNTRRRNQSNQPKSKQEHPVIEESGVSTVKFEPAVTDPPRGHSSYQPNPNRKPPVIELEEPEEAEEPEEPYVKFIKPNQSKGTAEPGEFGDENQNKPGKEERSIMEETSYQRLCEILKPFMPDSGGKNEASENIPAQEDDDVARTLIKATSDMNQALAPEEKSSVQEFDEGLEGYTKPKHPRISSLQRTSSNDRPRVQPDFSNMTTEDRVKDWMKENFPGDAQD